MGDVDPEMYNSLMTPEIDLTGIVANTVTIEIDSSWSSVCRVAQRNNVRST